MIKVDDTVTFNIDGVNYKLNLLCTSRAFLTGQEIMKLVLPSAGAAVDGLFSDELPIDNQTYATVAMLITNQMGSINILEIIKEIISGLTANDIPIDFETYFKRRLDLLIKILEVAIKENYGSLFTGSSLIEKLLKSMTEFQNQSQARNTQEETPTEQEE